MYYFSYSIFSWNTSLFLSEHNSPCMLNVATHHKTSIEFDIQFKVDIVQPLLIDDNHVYNYPIIRKCKYAASLISNILLYNTRDVISNVKFMVKEVKFLFT